MAATTVPAEVPISEARAILTDIATAAKEHGARTALTRHGKTVALVVHPDEGVMPGPDDWAAAQQAYDRAANLPNPYTEMQAAYEALGRLLSIYYGHDQEAPDGR